MKRLLLGLLMGMLVVTPVFAEENDGENKASPFFMHKERGDLLASNLMDKPVYITEGERVPERVTEAPEDWENVGNITDFVLTGDGTVRGLVFDVGGFLGIGTRAVAVSKKAVKILDIEEVDDFFVVLPGITREAIEAAPEFELQPTPLPVRRF